MSPAFVRASYTMSLVGLAGIPVGIYEAATDVPVLGIMVAAIGCAAATLAIYKLRSEQHWPFG